MRVAMYYHNQDVRIEERPVPEISAGELLVRLEASGICGSDVMEWYRRPKAPLVLGHEIAGEIVAVGEGVYSKFEVGNSRFEPRTSPLEPQERRFKEGDRVAIAHHVPCNTCYYCLNGRHTACHTLRQTKLDPGGFAEFVRVPAINVDRGVFMLPDSISFEEATFVEPLACVLRGQRLARLQPGNSVLVMGSGMAGQIHIKLARALGAGSIIATDIIDYRLNMAHSSGADFTIQATQDLPPYIRQVNQGRLADLVVICTGAEGAINQALSSVEQGGTILLFAPANPGTTIPLPVNDFFWKGVTITTSYAGSPADYATALELIRAGNVPVKDLITHRLGLAETELGFKLVAEAKHSMKVIIEGQK
ncbi:MAG TPA: alcohol dehydrogenase [Desulfotomaculum sp.]|nr:alcohol dehydrogenase [Desulfotomaculum sp.]